MLRTDLFDYDLPERLIAQVPSQRRDESRLLVVHRTGHRIEHRRFRDIGEYLRAGDTLFRNNAAVIPARLLARRPTGGEVECLLLRPADSLSHREGGEADCGDPDGLLRHSAPRNDAVQDWWCLLRPGKKLPVGATFELPGEFSATVLEKTGDGTARVRFDATGGDILAVANRVGDMPLPPYIERHQSKVERMLDRERYQTVYADRARQVAAAAPTAGLHFTPELLAQLATSGIKFADLTLHVGIGTFRPISVENVADHDIHRETYEVPCSTAEALFAPTGRRVAVGTTTVRSIEDFMARHRATPMQHFVGEAGIFIYPPKTFAGVDALITNFHQPRSTLLCLVSAFLAPGSTDGIAWLKEIYAEAIAREYRFFSYGDSMLIL